MIVGTDIVCDGCGMRERTDLPLVDGLIGTMAQEHWTAEPAGMSKPAGSWYHKCPVCNGYS